MGDGAGVPLALGIQAQVGTRLLKGGFDTPALDEIGQHFLGRQRQSDRQQGLAFQLVVGIFNQQPADGYDRQAGVIPDRRLGKDL